MSHCHVSRELLLAAAEGRLPRGTVSRIVLEHLAGRCPTCERELRRWLAWREVRGTARAAWGVTKALELLLSRLSRELRVLEPEAHRARRDLAELRRLPREEREPRMERARTRFQGPLLAELALQEARSSLPEKPEEAGSWAGVARFAAAFGWEQPERRQWLRALQARALAHAGNALRLREDFDEAEATFAQAWDRLRRGEVTDLVAFAEVACLEASLYRDRRRFPEAKVRLHFASFLYVVLRDLPALARTRLMRGNVYHAWDRPEEALLAAEAAEAALKNLAPGAELRLRLVARHNRVFYFCDLGRFAEAAELLEESRLLYERFDDCWTRLRLAWVEAKIARGLGRAEDAEDRFLHARKGFLAEGCAFDAALVSLELGCLYLDQSRTSDLLTLAWEMVETFRRLGVHREARAAAGLFAQAAAQESVTAELLGRLARYLQEARNRPGLRFGG